MNNPPILPHNPLRELIMNFFSSKIITMNSSKYHQKVLNILQKQTINSFVGYDGQVAGNNKTHGANRGFCLLVER